MIYLKKSVRPCLSSGCFKETPQTSSDSSGNRYSFLPLLEAGSLRSRHRQGGFRPAALACRSLPCTACSPDLLLHLQSGEWVSLTRMLILSDQGPTLMASSNPDHLPAPHHTGSGVDTNSIHNSTPLGKASSSVRSASRGSCSVCGRLQNLVLRQLHDP